MDLLPVLLVNGVVFGAIYGINAIGLGIVYNTTGIINFAQGDFVMLGGMTAAYFYGLGLPLPIAIVFRHRDRHHRPSDRAHCHQAAVAPRCEGLDLRLHAVAVATVAPNLAMLGIRHDPLPFIWRVADDPAEFGHVEQPSGVGARRDRHCGRRAAGIFQSHPAWQSHEGNRDQSPRRRLDGRPGRANGGDVVWPCGLLGAIGWVVFTPLISMQFDTAVAITLNGFAAAIIGGMGNTRGAIIGGLVIGILQSLSTAFISSVYGDAVTYGVLFVLLMIWPAGFFRPLTELQHEEI
jgi:branched-chain amino acid transport system permease protein